MATDMNIERLSKSKPVSRGDVDWDEVAAQLQRVYEHVLHDQRPEALGAIECLAIELDVDIERPEEFFGQAPR